MTTRELQASKSQGQFTGDVDEWKQAQGAIVTCRRFDEAYFDQIQATLGGRSESVGPERQRTTECDELVISSCYGALWVSQVDSFLTDAGPRFGKEELHRLLRRNYELENPDSVLMFISNNEFLVPILEEAIEQVLNVFGKVSVELAVRQMPEDVEYEWLNCHIRGKMTGDEAVDLLATFDQRWWLKRMDIVRGKLVFNVVF